jgi:hypothetical protein
VPTDHACRSAAEQTARGLEPLRTHLAATPSRDALSSPAGGRADGAAGLLAFLDGLHAELGGALTPWHAGVGERIRGALDVPVPGARGAAPAPQPYGWQALALVRSRAEEVLTALARRPHGRPAGAADLARRLELVEDAFADALRRLGVPAGEAAHCAAEVAAAAGSLFGVRPARRHEPPPQSAPSAPSSPPAPFSFPQTSDWTASGLP